MKRTLKLFLLLGGVTLFTVGCRLPFTEKNVTLPLLEKSPTKVAELNKEKTANITSSHIEMTADITGTGTGSTGDMSGTLTLKADSDEPGKKMQGSLTGTIRAANASYSFGLDLRSLNNVVYFQLTALPTLPGAASNALSDITNVWYRLDPSELQDSLSSSLGEMTGSLPDDSDTNQNVNTNGNININSNLNLNAALNANKQEEIINRLTDLARNADIYSLGDRLPDQKIAEVNCYHYKIVINQTEMRKFLNDIMASEGGILKGVSGLGLPVDQSETIDEAMNMLNDMNGEIWIGKKDYLTRKVMVDLTAAQDEQTLNVKVNLITSNFNQPVNVEAPAESKSFTELLQTAMMMLFGTTPTATINDTNDSDDYAIVNQQEIRIDVMKQSLALYRADKGAYPSTLNEINTFLDESCGPAVVGKLGCYLRIMFSPIDVYTDKQYPYAKTGDSYALTYEMDMNIPDQFQAGENTLTPDSRSLEAAPKQDQDQDIDGLLDVYETYWETDINIADTDGDNYLDGIELMNGFNPNGDGAEVYALKSTADDKYTYIDYNGQERSFCGMLAVFEKSTKEFIVLLSICEDNAKSFEHNGDTLLLTTEGNRSYTKNLVTGEEQISDNINFSGGFSKIF